MTLLRAIFLVLFCMSFSRLSAGESLSIRATGLSSRDTIPYALDVAVLRKETNINRISIKIENAGTADPKITTQPSGLSPLANISIKQFVSSIQFDEPRNQRICLVVELRAQISAPDEKLMSYISGQCDISFVRKVGVRWPLTTRSKFLGKAIVLAKINRLGEVVRAEIVDGTAADYSLNALSAIWLCTFSPGGGLRDIRVQFTNHIDDEGSECVNTEILANK